MGPLKHSFFGEKLLVDIQRVIKLGDFGKGIIFPTSNAYHASFPHLLNSMAYTSTRCGPALLSSILQGCQSATWSWAFWSMSPREVFVRESDRQVLGSVAALWGVQGVCGGFTPISSASSACIVLPVGCLFDLAFW